MRVATFFLLATTAAACQSESAREKIDWFFVTDPSRCELVSEANRRAAISTPLLGTADQDSAGCPARDDEPYVRCRYVPALVSTLGSDCEALITLTTENRRTFDSTTEEVSYSSLSRLRSRCSDLVRAAAMLPSTMKLGSPGSPLSMRAVDERACAQFTTARVLEGNRRDFDASVGVVRIMLARFRTTVTELPYECRPGDFRPNEFCQLP